VAIGSRDPPHPRVYPERGVTIGLARGQGRSARVNHTPDLGDWGGGCLRTERQCGRIPTTGSRL